MIAKLGTVLMLFVWGAPLGGCQLLTKAGNDMQSAPLSEATKVNLIVLAVIFAVFGTAGSLMNGVLWWSGSSQPKYRFLFLLFGVVNASNVAMAVSLLTKVYGYTGLVRDNPMIPGILISGILSYLGYAMGGTFAILLKLMGVIPNTLAHKPKEKKR